MHPRCYHNAFPTSHVLRVLLARNRYDVEGVACERVAERLSCGELSLHWVAHNLVKVVCQVCVGVRIAVREVDRVIFVLKVVSEGVRVV